MAVVPADTVLAFWDDLRSALVALSDEATASRRCRSTCRTISERCKSLQGLLDTFAAHPSLAQSPEALTSWGAILPKLEEVKERVREGNTMRDYIDAMKKKKVKKALLESLAELDTALAEQCKLLAKVAASKASPRTPTNGKAGGSFSLEEHVRSLLVQAQLGQVEEQQEAVRGLASVTDNNPETQRIVMMEGGVRSVLGLLGAAFPTTAAMQAQEHAVTVLYNVAKGSANGARAIAGHPSAIPTLVQILQAGTPGAQRGAAEVLCTLCESEAELKADTARHARESELVKLLRRLFPDEFILGESKKVVEESYQASLSGLLAQAEKTRAAAEKTLAAVQETAQRREEELLDKIRGLTADLAKEREASTSALAAAREAAQKREQELEGQLRHIAEGLAQQKTDMEGQLTEVAMPGLKDIEVLRNIAQRRDITLLALVLRYGTSEAKCKAAGILGDLAQGDANNSRTLSAYGGVPPLVECLRSQDPEVVESAVGALLAISVDPMSRKEIFKHGAVPLLAGCLEQDSAETKETTAALLWTLAEDDDGKLLIRQQSRMVGMLRNLAEGSMQGGREIAAKALSALGE